MVPTTVSYMKGKDIDYYINQAGGYSENAKKSKKFIARQFCQCLFFTAAFIIFDSIKRQEGRPAGLTLFKIDETSH